MPQKTSRKEKLYAFIAVFLGIMLASGLFLAADHAFTRTAAAVHLSLPYSDDCITSHPKRHHAFRPSCDGIYQWGREQHTVYTNDLGFFDDHIRTVEKDSGKPRILFLGDSFTVGRVAWPDTFVSRFARAFPQWEVLNSGTPSYAPSNYLLVTKELIEKGYRIDEVVVDFDISDIQDEASSYTDTGPDSVDVRPPHDTTIRAYTAFRDQLRKNFILTDYLVSGIERLAINLGYYGLPVDRLNNIFDMERSAWTYRPVDDTREKDDGYAPLGLQKGIEKAEAKMDALHDLLAAHGIPLTMVVYPWPAQLAHDVIDNREVTLWRDWCRMDDPAPKCKRFISLYPTFFAAKNACPPLLPGCWYPRLFIFQDIHYNAEGNALAAAELIKAFTNTPVLNPKSGQ